MGNISGVIVGAPVVIGLVGWVVRSARKRNTRVPVASMERA